MSVLFDIIITLIIRQLWFVLSRSPPTRLARSLSSIFAISFLFKLCNLLCWNKFIEENWMTQKFIHQVWRFTFNVTSGLDTHQAMRLTSSDTQSIDYKEAEFTMGHNPCFRVPEDVSRFLREQILTKMGGRFIESFRQKQNIMPCLLSLNR